MSGRFNLQDYVTVDERIDRYWQAHPKPEGSIQTEILWVSNDGNVVAIRATVYQGDRILATGIAQEERSTSGANKTSWWENCETSAIGRALANMGMSLSQRASREEMQKVQRGGPDYGSEDTQVQDAPRRASARQEPPQRPQQAPQATAPTMTAEEFTAFIDGEKARRSSGTPYEQIVAAFTAARKHWTPDQTDDAREYLKQIKAWTPEGTAQ